MIKTIHIKSFKSLRDVTVELGLLNIFIGANGSGKSNFLEAVGLLSAAVSGEVNNLSLMRRGVRPGMPALYKSSFQKQSVTEFISLSARSTDTHYEVELQNSIKHPKLEWTYRGERLYQEQKETQKMLLQDLQQKSKETSFDRGKFPLFSSNESDGAYTRGLHLPPEQGLIPLLMLMPWVTDQPQIRQTVEALKNFQIYSPNTESLRNLRTREQFFAPLGLDGAGLGYALWTLYQNSKKDRSENWRNEIVFDFFGLIGWADSIGFTTNSDFVSPKKTSKTHKNADKIDLYSRYRSMKTSKTRKDADDWNLYFQDRFMEKKYAKLSDRDVSEGALMILFLAAILAHPEIPRFCAVDNADFGLNPRLVKNLFYKLSEWTIKLNGQRQLLLTTHNPLVLDGLLLKDDRIRLFTVDRDTTGATTINQVKITPELLEKARAGTSLSQMWVEGYLGGMPSDLL